MKLLQKIKANKIKFLVIVIIILLVSLISITTVVRNSIEKQKLAEELSSFSWESKLFTVNDDYSYTFQTVVTVQEINGIDTIKYEKNGKEIIINGNGKQKIAIDYEAHEDTDYNFEIISMDGKNRKEVLNVIRKYAGTDTYKLEKGVYINTPFLENFNEKYTRYLSVTENDTLTPSNWIYNEEPSDWYDYNNQKWANIYVECEGVEAYYVWVPRYVYKLDQDTQRSDVKFVDVYNNYTNAETGEKLTYEQLREQGYQLPETFTWGDNMPTEISGYWISKYQLSELAGFKLDYNMTAGKSVIVLANFTNTVSATAKTYTYAINGEIKNTSSTLDDYTFTGLTENNSYIVNVTALDEKGSILASMTKVLEPTEVNEPDLSSFDPDTTFYVYYDEDGIEHNEIPISKSAPEDWYNYTYSNWANIVTRNDGLETYYVWVPRYQYKLNQTSQRSDVKFILGTSTATDTGYQIPEAFWWDKNDDGVETDDEELTGYWITKYQLTREASKAKITAELASGTDCIHVKDITGTALTVTDADGVVTDVPLKYEYYLNGELKHEGTSSTEQYTYVGLTVDTTYTVNIIARNSLTNQYVGAITKKMTTKAANDPDLSSFISNNSLKTRTYYVVYNGEEISGYVPITENIPDNWYDYSQSRWANIVVTDGNVSGNTITDATATSYFVWIPRYEYQILNSVNDWSNLDTSNARTYVKFLAGTSTTTDNGYQIPEAFWWDKNDDGVEDEGEQLTGYWMSKYQLTNK